MTIRVSDIARMLYSRDFELVEGIGKLGCPLVVRQRPRHRLSPGDADQYDFDCAEVDADGEPHAFTVADVPGMPFEVDADGTVQLFDVFGNPHIVQLVLRRCADRGDVLDAIEEGRTK